MYFLKITHKEKEKEHIGFVKLDSIDHFQLDASNPIDASLQIDNLEYSGVNKIEIITIRKGVLFPFKKEEI